jgi:hypothetical protein
MSDSFYLIEQVNVEYSHLVFERERGGRRRRRRRQNMPA